MTLLSIVLMFAFFVLLYLPYYQAKYLLQNFEKEIGNNARTVALGIEIAIIEQHFESIQHAMDYVKNDPNMKYVSILQVDTIWSKDRSTYELQKKVFRSYPENAIVDVDSESTDSVIIKRAPFSSPIMGGEIVIAESTSEVFGRVHQIRNIALLVSIAILIIGIIIGRWLAKNISIPVLALRDAAAKVGMGDLTQRVSARYNDEIGELGNAFNKMVDDLSSARKQLDQKTTALIQEKKKSDDLLEELKHSLEDLKETQDRLIRHEKLASIGQLTKGIVDRLLNPLNYINNFSLISNDYVNEVKNLLDDDNCHLDERTYKDISELLALVNSNMTKINEHGVNASRIVKGMEKLLKEKSSQYIDTDINKLIEVQLQTGLLVWQDGINKVKVTTSYCVSDKKIKVLPSEISSVIMNLVSNAMYSVTEKSKDIPDYAPEIKIMTTITGGYFEIHIRDNGTGITQKEMSQIFSPFFTTKPTATGTGLGLYTSLDSIKSHKGDIKVNSVEGEFAEFIVSLPLYNSEINSSL